MFSPLLDALSKIFPFKSNPVLRGEDAENFLEKVERGRLQRVGPVPTPRLHAALERFRRDHEIDFDEHICSPCNHVAFSGGRDVCGYYLVGGDTVYITKEMREKCVLHVFDPIRSTIKKPLPVWYRRYFDLMEKRG